MRAESAEVTLEEARSLVVSSPRPAYPFEVRKRHESGSGTAVVTIDPATGEVVKAEMRVSTRNEMLDNAALSAFSHWRFKPGTVTKVRILIEFRLSGEVRIIEKAAAYG
jgi:TonB family protein